MHDKQPITMLPFDFLPPPHIDRTTQVVAQYPQDHHYPPAPSIVIVQCQFITYVPPYSLVSNDIFMLWKPQQYLALAGAKTFCFCGLPPHLHGYCPRQRDQTRVHFWVLRTMDLFGYPQRPPKQRFGLCVFPLHHKHRAENNMWHMIFYTYVALEVSHQYESCEGFQLDCIFHAIARIGK